jgi:hypothetical protein
MAVPGVSARLYNTVYQPPMPPELEVPVVPGVPPPMPSILLAALFQSAGTVQVRVPVVSVRKMTFGVPGV